MRAQNDIFGFSWSHTQTDVNGCFRFSKSYTAKDINVRLLYNNDRIWMRSWRGARIWNLILPMTSRKIKIIRPFNDECLVFADDNSDESSVTKEEWSGCTLFNAVEDYHTIMPSYGLELPSGRLEISITHHGHSAAAPMLSEQFEETLLDDIVLVLFGIADPILGIVVAAVKEGLPDIWFSYDLFEPSDYMKQVMYHELGHASHYTKAGGDFWGDYIAYIIAFGSYGDGNDPGNGIIAIAEPFAEAVGVYMADIQYSTNHSNGNPTNDRWIFELEEENLNNSDSDWIPWGIYYDLVDNNPENPNGVNDSVNDGVTGYQISNIYNVLTFDVRDLDILENRLLGIIPQSLNPSELNLLFVQYEY